MAAALALAALGATACDRGEANSAGTVPVVTAFYPLQFVAEQVGGDAVAATNLAKPGAEPHDLELDAGQVRRIADAKLVVYLHGFQPAVDEAVDQQAKATKFDAAAVEPLRGGDPHIWLDPMRLAAIADKLGERLATVDPDHAADYQARAATLRSKLEALDKEYAEGLTNCQRKEIVTSHAAFGYLAARYGLAQLPIAGLSPEEEPSAQRLAEIATEAKAHGTTTIFFETLVSPAVARTLARQVGAKAEVLDPIEGLEPGSTGDYFSVMRANLGRLRTALGCT